MTGVVGVVGGDVAVGGVVPADAPVEGGGVVPPVLGGGAVVPVAGGAVAVPVEEGGVPVAGGVVGVEEVAVPVEGGFDAEEDPEPEELGTEDKREEPGRTPDPQPAMTMAAQITAHTPIPRRDLFKFITLLS